MIFDFTKKKQNVLLDLEILATFPGQLKILLQCMCTVPLKSVELRKILIKLTFLYINPMTAVREFQPSTSARKENNWLMHTELSAATAITVALR